MPETAFFKTETFPAKIGKSTKIPIEAPSLSREISKRKSENARREKEYEAAAIIKHEELEAYRNQSLFKKMFAKLKVIILI